MKTSHACSKVKLLDHLVSKGSLTSKYPKSLHEIDRKQNVSSGLTVINDNTFEFFLDVSKKRLKYHNEAMLALHGPSCLSICEQEMKKDAGLQKMWQNLFSDFTSSTCTVTGEDSLQIELFYDVTRFLRIGNNEFRKEILQKFGREKSERLRKKVVSSETKEKAIAPSKPQPGSSASTSLTNIETLEVPNVSQTTKRKLPKKKKSRCAGS